MLTRADSITIRRAFEKKGVKLATALMKPPEDAATKEEEAIPPADAVRKIAEVAAIKEDKAKEFYLFAASRTIPEYAGQPDKMKALRETLGVPNPVAVWSKPNPPLATDQLSDPEGKTREPWMEEYYRLATVAKSLSYKEVLKTADPDAWAPADLEFLARCILGEMQIGGLEDYGDPRAMPANDPTVLVMIQSLYRKWLPIAQPTWFVDGVLTKNPPTDGRPRLELELDELDRVEKQKADARRESASARRKSLYVDAKRIFPAFCEKFGALKPVQHVVEAVKSLDFLTYRTYSYPQAFDDASSGMVDWYCLEANTRPKTGRRMIAILVAEFVNRMMQPRHPDWFRENDEGFLIQLRGARQPRPDKLSRTDLAVVRRLVKALAHLNGDMKSLDTLVTLAKQQYTTDMSIPPPPPPPEV